MAETDTAVAESTSAESRVRASFDALARRDAKAMAALWREDGVEEIVPVGMLRGPAEIEAFFAGLFAALPDVETTVKRVVAQGDRVAVEWQMEGHFTGAPFQGVEATGKRVEMRGFDLFECEDGLLVSNTAYYDGMAFGRQVGMMPPMDSAAEKAMKSGFNALTKARRAIAERKNG
jgi:steroid delta-isomerase-like uncharacterized protein